VLLRRVLKVSYTQPAKGEGTFIESGQLPYSDPIQPMHIFIGNLARHFGGHTREVLFDYRA
jgi:hypothetical protein